MMKKYDSNIKFIYSKPKPSTVVILFYMIFLNLVIILALTKEVYSKIQVKGIVTNSNIVIPTTLDNISKISISDKLKIDSKEYKFKILNYSELYTEGNVNIQDVIINSDVKNKKDNQVIDITFYYNKEKLIKKIWRGVFK